MEDKDKRRRRNERYYLKQKRAAGSSNLIRLFPKQLNTNSKVTQMGGLYFLSLGALILLSMGLTSFLVTETIKFFSDIEGRGSTALLKGFLCEAIVVTFSLFRFRDFFSRCMQYVVLIGMCFYSLWAISSGVILRAHQEYRESNASKQMISDLEAQIRDKEGLIEKYLARDWIGVARASQKDSDVLRRQLLDLRSRSSEIRPFQLILNTVLGLVLFRLMVMIANILCLRRLKEMLSTTPIRFWRCETS